MRTLIKISCNRLERGLVRACNRLVRAGRTSAASKRTRCLFAHCSFTHFLFAVEAIHV